MEKVREIGVDNDTYLLLVAWLPGCSSNFLGRQKWYHCYGVELTLHLLSWLLYSVASCPR
mgnify:CR=1 FL=1